MVDVGADHNPQLNEVNMAGVTLQHGNEWLGADPEYIIIADTETNMRTEAFTTMQMPADIGPNWLGRVHSKVDTGAGGNVMSLHVFQKLFPNQLNANGNPLACAPQPPNWQPTMEVPYPNLVPMTQPFLEA